MSITAARFGSSPLMLDWSGLRALAPEATAQEREQLWATWQNTTRKLHDQVSGFYNAVITPELSQAQPSIDLAQKFKTTLASGNTIKDCIFIGIGGSSLGPMCVLDSLKHLADGKIQFHFFENPDPIDWNYRIQKLNAAQTMVCVVTKSGTTYETLSIFMLAYDWLKRGVGPQNAAAHTVAITDPEKGELLEFARKEGIQTLSIAPSVGGRYSVFTPVGLFAVSLAGLNVEAFLTGAKKVRDYCEKTTVEKNLFLTWSYYLNKLYGSHRTHVMMPYSTPIRLLANWWVQLWAESLGKDGKGYTAIPSLGAIDQHSMLQLLRDGPNDKMIWFVNVQDFKTTVKIPSLGFKVKSFELLENQELGSLLDTEFRAVQRTMSSQKRPHLQIQIDSINEESMGSMLFALSVLTSYMGDVMNVNPFDQPGVEEAKVYIRESLLQKKQQAHQDAIDGDKDEVHRLRLHQNKD